MTMAELCELCGCDQAVTAHHLIPRKLHRNRWFKKTYPREVLRRTALLCRGCHREIHNQIPDEKVMGKSYQTLEALRAHPKISAYVAWKRKRPALRPRSRPA